MPMLKLLMVNQLIINLCVGLESYNQLHKTIEQIKSMADVLDIARVGQS